ncbi:MAG TPA: FAD-binding oxidoreductase [Streptosporangiaceae bacterium]
MTRGRTIWIDQLQPGELAALDLGRPSQLPQRPDVLVVGGGMLGVVTAVACQAAGLGQVLLIEAGRLGSGATGGAAGLVTPEPHDGTDLQPIADLGRVSLARWLDLQASVPGGVGLIEIDWLGLDPRPGAFGGTLSPAAERLDATQVHTLIPALHPAVPGVLIRNQARVNPLRAITRLAAQLPHKATGCPATAVRLSNGRIATVATPAGDISPGAVVFATGLPPRLDGLTGPDGHPLDIPAGTVKGHLAVTEPLPLTLPGSVEMLGTQLEDGSVLSGGTLDTGDSTPDVRPEVAESIRAGVAARLPSLNPVRLSHQWCCWRPRHPDGLAVIDRVPGLANAWLTSGHYRTGIMMAPAAGAALAGWIASGGPPPGLDPWLLSQRFSP